MRRTGPRAVVGLVAGAALVPIVLGCCRKAPQGVVEVNLALGRAKSACATLYAPEGLAAIERRITEVNRLADQGKCRRAREAADPVLPEVVEFAALVEARRDVAGVEADEALAAAQSALQRAKAAPEAPGEPGRYGAAERTLAAALRMRADPCALPTVADLAREAAEAAERSRPAGPGGTGRPEDGAREGRRP
jgi:hypothetical protein